MSESNREVYLAARFTRREEMKSYIPALNNLGFGVPARWISGDHNWTGEPSEKTTMTGRRFAHEDWADLQAARIVIVFTEEPAPGGRNRGGRHVEFGMAIAMGKPTIIVGPYENVFHTLASFRVDTFEEALKVVEALDR